MVQKLSKNFLKQLPNFDYMMKFISEIKGRQKDKNNDANLYKTFGNC